MQSHLITKTVFAYTECLLVNQTQTQSQHLHGTTHAHLEQTHMFDRNVQGVIVYFKSYAFIH